MRKLEAPEGFVYTNGDTEGSVIYLGKHDSPDNWHLVDAGENNPELTDSEALEIIMGGAV